MRIAFVPKNIDASGWYRCMFPAHYLSERGHFAQAPPMAFFRPDGTPVSVFQDGQLPEGWVTCRFGDYPDADVYVFQMTNDPSVVANTELDYQGTTPTLKMMPGLFDQIKAQGRKVVVELDDDLLHVPAYNPFTDDPKWLHRSVELADHVVVATPGLRRCYRVLNPNVTVLRNRLHWPMWAELPPVFERQEWRRLRVGWMGILEYHREDLKTLNPWLSEWLREHPDVEFVSVGGAGVHDFLNIPDAQRVTTDRTDFRHLELAYVTSVMDIGLVPLIQNHFNEGKSYLKGLEYSACGIVPLATPTSQYKELITDGVDGFLCAYPFQWKNALDTLYEDRETLQAMGMNAYRKASEWTYERHIGEWETFYEEISGNTRQLWDPGDSADTITTGAGAAVVPV